MTAAQPRILIVEDDPDLRGAVQSLLEEEGYSVTVASNGADALLILRLGNPPDLIILDLMLPIVSGWEFSTELAREERLARIPLVILSAIADGREAALLRVAPENCVKKPFYPEELLAAVRRCIPESPAP